MKTAGTNGSSAASSLSSTSSSSSSGGGGVVGTIKLLAGVWSAALLANVLYGAGVIFNKHFYLQDFSTWSLDDMRTNTTWVRRDVPITYYKYKELYKVLPPNGWLSAAGDEGLRVFRLAPGEEEKFLADVDISKIQSKMRMEPVDEECINKHAWSTCENENCVLMHNHSRTGTILDVLDTDESVFYGSFAEIDEEAVDYLESLLHLPFPLDRGQFEQSFCSNFKNDILATPIHANPYTHSMAVQVLGQKSWVIIRATDWFSKQGMWATSLYGPYRPLKAPSMEQMDWFAYKSRPGDVLYFPGSYGHTVYTHSGKNLMVNYRKAFINQYAKHWNEVVHAFINLKFFNKATENQQAKRTGEGKDKADTAGGHSTAQRKYKDVFKMGCFDDDPTNMNLILANLAKEVAATME